MKKEDILHMNNIVYSTTVDIMNKYREGCAEHGGDLQRKPVIEFISDEVIDQICYLSVLKQQWNDMIKIARSTKIEASGHSDAFRMCEILRLGINKIENILTMGNPEGIETEGD